MDCGQVRNLLSDYQDGRLGGAAATALASHLRGCGDCARCAGSLLAVRELLRGIPPDPAPPDLFARVLAAVEAEDRGARPDGVPKGTGAPRPLLSRLRAPLQAAAAVLLFASVYLYHRPSTPAARPPSGPATGMSSEAGKGSSSRPMAAKEDIAGRAVSGSRRTSGNPVSRGETSHAAPKPRAWTEADLPSAPAIRASSNSEKIVPVATDPGTGSEDVDSAEIAESRTPGSTKGERRSGPRPSGVLAAPPSRLLRPSPYGRDVVVAVNAGTIERAAERIAETAERLGGIVERIERGPDGTGPGGAGTVRVILPETSANRFLEEVGRIGAIPPEGKPAAVDLPAGPRPGTVAYSVRIRVR